MSKILVALVTTLSCLSLPLFGQSPQVDVSVGEPYRVINTRYKNYYIEGKELMIVKYNFDYLFIQKFNANDLTLIKRTDYREKFRPRYISIEHVGKVGGKYYVFYRVWNKKIKREDLWAKEINFETGELTSTSIHLLNFDSKVDNLILNYRHNTTINPNIDHSPARRFDYRYSNDSSKYLIVYKKNENERRDLSWYETWGMHIFNSSLDTLWNKEIVMPYKKSEMDMIDYSVDASGNAHMLLYAKQSSGSVEQGNYKKDYRLELFTYKPNEETPSKIRLNFEVDQIDDIALIESKRNLMQCVGYYRDTSKNVIEGIAKVKFDVDHQLQWVNYYPFDSTLIHSYEENKDNLFNTILSNVMVNQVEISDSGDLTIVGEQINHKSSTNYLVYGNLIIAQINQQDQLEWITKLPKSQLAGYGESTKKVKLGEDYYYFYIHHEVNKDRTAEEGVHHVTGGQGDLITFQVKPGTGTNQKVPILNTRQFNGHGLEQFDTFRIIKINENEVVFEAYKDGQEDVLVKISLAL